MDNKSTNEQGSELRPLKTASARYDTNVKSVIGLNSGRTPGQPSYNHQGGHKKLLALIGSLVVIVATAAGIVAWQNNRPVSDGVANKSQLADRYPAQDIILDEEAISPDVKNLATTQSLSVNGQLKVNNSFIIGPSARPTTGTKGQVYFDNGSNQIMYYNGSAFTALAQSNEIDGIRNQVSAVNDAVNVLQSAEVPTLPTDVARMGVGNTFTTMNEFVAGLSSSQIKISGGTTTKNLTVNENTRLGGRLTVTGDVTLGATTISNLILNSPLAISSGGTGTNTLTNNGVLIGKGSSPISAVTASASNLCLMSTTTGAPEFKTCPGGGGSGIEAINGIDGNLTIANSSAFGTTITIDNASTTAKGIASFNASNFSVVAGNVNTIQNIGVTATPTFAAATINGSLSATTLTGSGAGVTNVDAARLNGQVASFYLNASNQSTGTLADGRLSNNVALKNASNNFTGTLQQNGNDVCTSANNCNYLTGSAANGSYVQLQPTTGTPQTGNLNISGTATAANFTGNGSGLTNVNAVQLGSQGASYYLNATNLSSGTLADGRLSNNVALKNSAANFLSTLQQNGNDVCTSANNCNYLTGSAANGSYVQLQAGTPGTTQVGNLNINGTIIAANLVGSGTSISNLNASNLTAGSLADARLSNNVTLQGNVFNGASQLVRLNGSLELPAVSGALITNLNGSNVSTGTVADARLSGNVALKNVAANFTGSLQQGGNDVCTTAGNCVGSGSGGALGGGGTAGTIAVFSGSGYTVANSLLSQAGSKITTAGDEIGATGALTLSAGGLNQSVFLQGSGSGNVVIQTPVFKNANGATYEFDTSDSSAVTATICTSTGNCDASMGSFVQLQAASPGVAQTGNLNITGSAIAANLVGSGSAITNLNATNITSGTLADSRLSANVTLQGNTFNGASQLVRLNASGQLPALSGALVTSLNGTNIASGTVADARLSGNVALKNVAANFTGSLQQGGNDVCTTAGNCVGSGSGGALGGGGTAGTIAVFSGSGYTLTDSLLSQAAGTVAVDGDLSATNLSGNGSGVTNVNAAQLNGQVATYYLNAGNLTTGTLSDARLSGNVALKNEATNFLSTLQQGGNDVCTMANNCGYLTGSEANGSYVQLQATTGTAQVGNLNIDGTATAASFSGNGSELTNVNAIQLNGQSAAYYLNAGSLNAGTLADERLSNNVALKDALVANFTGDLQQGGFSVCTTAGNCVGSGSGGGIGGSGTANTIAMFTGTGYTIADSLLSQSGGAVTVAGNLIATSLSGNGSGVTDVNAVQLNGQSAAYYLNAGNLTGTLADARLSANVALLNASQSFTGAVTFAGTGTALQVTNSASIGGTLAVTGAASAASVSTGTSGVSVNNGTASTTILSGAAGTVTLQNVTIVPNGTVKVGDSGMGVLYTDASGRIQKLDVSGQSGNCVGYNGTSIVFQGCSGSGGGITTEFANGGNNFTTGNGTTATSRINTSYDQTITNPVLGLSSNAALDIVTNNISRINIQSGGDVSVLSNSGASTGKFTVRTQNTGDPAQYINTLVVDTTTAGSIGGRVGIGLTVGTAPQVTLDVGGGINNYGGSGIQVRASAAPGLSVSGNAGAGSLSTGRIYYDQTDRKFKVSENGGAFVDLVQTAGSNPILQGGNNSPSATIVIGNKYANGNGGLLIGTANNNSTISSGFKVDSNGNYLFDKPYNDNDQYGFRVNGAGGNSALHVDTRYNVVSIGNLTTNSTNSYGSLVVGGNGIMSTGGFRVGTGSEDVGITLTCSSSQSTVDAPQFKNGILVKSNGCRANNSDLAEAYNSTDNLEPGELVMAAGTAATSVSRATSIKETALMGVVSTAPAQVIGTAQVPNGYPIALSGRVPTKVNGEGGAIAVGDKITISSVPGVGKKATSAGMIVGTAVESFDGNGTGSIEVFVNLTYFEPTSSEMLQSSAASFGELNVSGAATIQRLTVTDATVNGNLTVNGLTIVKTIVVNGHIVTAGGQPQVTAKAASGNGSVIIDGNDTAGTITITTGSTPSIGEMAALVFSQAYAKSPRVVISAGNEAAASIGVYKDRTSTSGASISTKDSPQANTTYIFDYFIVE